MELSTATQPAFLGSMNEPAQGDATQPLFGALNGAKALLGDYATRSRAIFNANDLGDYVAEARMRVINQRLGDLVNEVLSKASRYDSIVTELTPYMRRFHDRDRRETLIGDSVAEGVEFEPSDDFLNGP